jgi:hypothetical protein
MERFELMSNTSGSRRWSKEAAAPDGLAFCRPLLALPLLH